MNSAKEWLQQSFRRVRMLLRGERFDRDLDEEMRLHRELRERELLESGATPDATEAHYAAHRALGNELRLREESRDAWGWLWLEHLVQDARYAVRGLLKNPGFAAVAILTLALGMGANTAIFSIVNSVLLKPLPYADSRELVWITESIPPPINDNIVDGGEYLDWHDQSRSLEQIAAFQTGDFNLTGGSKPLRVHAGMVTANFLDLLGYPLAQGRSFSVEEDRPKGNPVVVVSHSLWSERFGPGAVLSDQTLQLDGRRYSIVGVLAPGFRFPHDPDVRLLVPLALDPVSERAAGPYEIVEVIGRLRPGVTLEEARSELSIIHERTVQAREGAFRASQPARSAGDGPQVMLLSAQSTQTKILPLHQFLVGNVRAPLILLLVAVGVVLLIGCVNLANLLLARSAARNREFAVRVALGAGRKRLVGQLLTESCLLGLLGGGVGLAAGFGGMQSFLRFPPAGQINSFFRQVTIRIDGRVLAFTLALSLFTGILFGLMPALSASRIDVNDSLKDGKRGIFSGHRRNPLRGLLIVSELALALILLAGAGLFLRSFYRLVSVDPGFQPENVLTASLYLPPSQYSDVPSQVAFANQLLQKVGSLPGVESAGLTDTLPLSGGPNRMIVGLHVTGEAPLDLRKTPVITLVGVTPGYFDAIGMRVVKGRNVDSQLRDSSQVAVISTSLARRFFGDRDPLGHDLTGPVPGSLTIVGEVDDVRRGSLDTTPELALYLPLAPLGSLAANAAGKDARALWDPHGNFSIAVRARISAASLTSAVRSEMATLDSSLPLYNVATMEQRVSDSVSPRRFNALLLAMFAALALVLAAVGIYGVISFGVAQRTHEIGVRMALGARPVQLLRLVIGEALSLALVGVIIGVAGALAVTRFIRAFLFEVSATDPLTFAGVAALLLFVALLAGYLPARRAMRVDPMVALRHE